MLRMDWILNSPGLSFLTNQYGIATANIVALELVLPSGQVTTVTAKSNPDLFFAVRVRFCTYDFYFVFWIWLSFRALKITSSVTQMHLKYYIIDVLQGIVTSITTKAYKQGLVWVSRFAWNLVFRSNVSYREEQTSIQWTPPTWSKLLKLWIFSQTMSLTPRLPPY